MWKSTIFCCTCTKLHQRLRCCCEEDNRWLQKHLHLQAPGVTQKVWCQQGCCVFRSAAGHTRAAASSLTHSSEHWSIVQSLLALIIGITLSAVGVGDPAPTGQQSWFTVWGEMIIHQFLRPRSTCCSRRDYGRVNELQKSCLEKKVSLTILESNGQLQSSLVEKQWIYRLETWWQQHPGCNWNTDKFAREAKHAACTKFVWKMFGFRYLLQPHKTHEKSVFSRHVTRERFKMHFLPGLDLLVLQHRGRIWYRHPRLMKCEISGSAFLLHA